MPVIITLSNTAIQLWIYSTYHLLYLWSWLLLLTHTHACTHAHTHTHTHSSAGRYVVRSQRTFQQTVPRVSYFPCINLPKIDHINYHQACTTLLSCRAAAGFESLCKPSKPPKLCGSCSISKKMNVQCYWMCSLRKYFLEASKMKYLQPLVKIPTLSPVSGPISQCVVYTYTYMLVFHDTLQRTHQVSYYLGS